MLAASAVQVTFGLEIWDLSYFNQILVFPSEYKNPFTNKLHKGETNLGGFMCFSWEDFLEGNKNPADKINLGLHEFAHALRFNGIKGDDTDYFFEHYFPKWVSCASKEFVKLRNNVPSIFRKYGGVNINEFFSVTVETFFENSVEFEQHVPELYRQTSILLNQTYSSKTKTWEINCRKTLLKESKFSLRRMYPNALSYNFKHSSYIVGVAGFLFVAVFAMLGEGYKYPSPYICFAIAFLFWILLERSHTEIKFSNNTVIIQKGYALLKNYKTVIIYGDQLISLIGSMHNEISKIRREVKTICTCTVTYMKESEFYEEEIVAEIDRGLFNELVSELKNNNVHVFIQD